MALEAQPPSLWQRYTRWRQTSRAEAQAAERSLLSLSGLSFTTHDVPVSVSDASDFVHGVKTGGKGSAVVLAHGYGAGLGFWFRTLRPVAEAGHEVHAVDWRGCGLSGRPPWRARSHDESVAFFVDGLEAWRKAQELESFVLVGHSLGGALAVRYTLAHPERVSRLVLVSPAGLAARAGPPPDTRLHRLVAYAWNAGATPHGFMRLLGPAAPRWAAGYASRRFVTRPEEAPSHFGGLSEREKAALGEYMHHTLTGDASGEMALPHLLAPGAYAHEPLLPLISREIRVPVTFIYGDGDWMDWRLGQQAVQALQGRGVSASLHRVANAGHFPFIDDACAFNALLLAGIAGRQADYAHATTSA